MSFIADLVIFGSHSSSISDDVAKMSSTLASLRTLPSQTEELLLMLKCFKFSFESLGAFDTSFASFSKVRVESKMQRFARIPYGGGVGGWGL